MLTVGSLFSGVGGLDMGLSRAGMRVLWQVEIDPDARAVLRRRHPGVTVYEDVSCVGSCNCANLGRDAGEQPRHRAAGSGHRESGRLDKYPPCRSCGRTTLPHVDVIVGGFPCQDVSVAGRRAGLAGERSGLFFEACRIISELRPTWVCVENVPGLLSSNGGRDMGAVVGALAQLGYGWSYRVLDSQYFGVAQRRRRVFIVGHAGGVCPPEVLFEPESLPGDPAPSREARKGATARARAGVEVAGALGGGSCRQGPRSDTDRMTFVPDTPPDIAGTVSAKWAKGTGEPAGDEAQNLVAVPPDAYGMDWTQHGAVPNRELSPSLRVGSKLGIPSSPAVLYPHPQPAVAHTLRGEGFDASNSGGGQIVGLAVPRRLTPRECERLQGWPDDWTRYGDRAPAMRLRRVRPLPDRRDGVVGLWACRVCRSYERATQDIGRDCPTCSADPERWQMGVEMSDSARYRMCGNGVTANVTEWIGHRMLAAHAALGREAAA